jgi:hypothetical protein
MSQLSCPIFFSVCSPLSDASSKRDAMFSSNGFHLTLGNQETVVLDFNIYGQLMKRITCSLAEHLASNLPLM